MPQPKQKQRTKVVPMARKEDTSIQIEIPADLTSKIATISAEMENFVKMKNREIYLLVSGYLSAKDIKLTEDTLIDVSPNFDQLIIRGK